MNTNDVLRRIRYSFNFDDSKMIAIFGLAGLEVTRAQISDWLKKDDDPDFVKCSDQQLATFLNGLIIDKRGRKDGPQPEPEKQLSNNIIFRKLKIALDLQADGVLEIVVGLTRESYDDVRGDRDLRDRVSQPCDALQKVVAVVATPHSLEYA